MATMHRATTTTTGLMDRPITAMFLLFVLCSGGCGALGSGAEPTGPCDWLTHGYDHLSNRSIVLLDQMGGEMTEDGCPVHFPVSFYEKMRTAEVESRIGFIRDSLLLISGLYDHGDPSSVAAWDSSKMEEFLITVHRQVEELRACVRRKQPSDRKLRRYYRKLRKNVLRKMGYSKASWELIRKETKHHLQQLHLLFATLTH